MKIEQGRFYRFRNTSTIYLVLYVWPPSTKTTDEGRTLTPESAECVIVKAGMRASLATLIHPISTLLDWLTCEVSPTWVDIDAQGQCSEPAQLAKQPPAEYKTQLPARVAESISWLDAIARGEYDGEA